MGEADRARRAGQDGWDAVWADYDARAGSGPPAGGAAASADTGSRPRRRARLGILALLAAVAASAGAASSLAGAALGTAAALRMGDARALRASGLDWEAVRAEAERGMALGAPGDLTPPALAYLALLRAELAAALATPEGMAEVAKARVAASARPPEPSAAGADGVRFDLSPASGSPPALSFVLAPALSPPGWRLVGIRLHERAPGKGFNSR